MKLAYSLCMLEQSDHETPTQSNHETPTQFAAPSCPRTITHSLVP
jgi:hypothetical protein